MSHHKSRPIDSKDTAKKFLVDVLGYRNGKRLSQYVKRITDEEIYVQKYRNNQTLFSPAYRDPRFADEAKRQKLHARIYKELMNNKYVSDESQLDRGMVPSGGFLCGRTAYLVIGLPASGKSGIAEKIADITKSMILDPDIAKSKFPEMSDKGGADLVGQEATLLVFGDSRTKGSVIKFSIQQKCIELGRNIVIPQVGDELEKIRKYRDVLLERDYGVHLILVDLDRENATKRALHRYLEKGRYVPLTLIYDSYADSPALNYFRVKFDKEWASVCEINNCVKKGQKPILVHCSGSSPAIDLKKGGYLR